MTTVSCAVFSHFTAGEDYVSISGIMLTFAPFTNTVCINLAIIDDTLEEEDEVFVIEMSSLTKGAVADQSAVLVTIRDDDCELINALDTTPHSCYAVLKCYQDAVVTFPLSSNLKCCFEIS